LIWEIISETLRPEIQHIFAEIPPNKKRDYKKILGWELHGKSPTRLQHSKWVQFLFLPVAGANFGIPLLAAILSVATFLIVASGATYNPLEVVLIVINGMALIYSAYWGFRAESLR
jgi:hypothetical protein